MDASKGPYIKAMRGKRVKFEINIFDNTIDYTNYEQLGFHVHCKRLKENQL